MFVTPYDRFYKACEQGNSEIVHESIERGVSPERKCSKWKGHSPLHFAAKHGDLNSVRTFIEVYRCNARCRDDSGCTPMHCACCSGHIDVVKYLVLECGCDPNTVDRENASPLHYACSTRYYAKDFRYWQSHTKGELSANNAAVSKFLMEHNCDPLKCDSSGRKPPVLHLACKFGPLEFVQSLIKEKGCDTNTYDEKGHGLLHVACEADLQILKYLINGEYCNPTKCSQQGYNILHIACQNQDIETVRYLASHNLLAVLNLSSHDQHPKIDSPLLMACRNGNSEIIECFVGSKGCNLNEEDQNGLTPLHYVCENEPNLQLVRLLINAGANPAHYNQKHESPIHVACRHGNLELLKTLTCKCVNINSIDKDDNCPLHIACQHNQIEVVRYLIEKKLSITSEKNKAGELPLHYTNSLPVVKPVSSNCDVLSKTVTGDTPLHTACLRQALDVVKFLILEKCSDPNIQNCEGELPLHTALKHIKRQGQSCQYLDRFDEAGDFYDDDRYWNDDYRHSSSVHNKALLEIVNLVSDKRSLYLKNKAGETPLHIACRKWILDIVKYLTLQKKYDPSKHPEIYANLQIHCACEDRNLSLLRVLTTASNVNFQDVFGNCALHVACINENFNAVKYLTLEMQCRQDIENNEGELPLHISCAKKSLKIIQLVSNCNVNSKTLFSGESPLHIACKSGHLEAVRYLTKMKHCDQKIVSEESEQLPLHIACEKSLDMVRLVSECDVNYLQCKYWPGGTALHIACRRVSLDITKYLVEKMECDINIKAWTGELPIHIACRSQCLELVKLVSKIPDPNSKLGEFGQCNSPLHIACSSGNVDIVRFLVSELNCDPKTLNIHGQLPLHFACSQSIKMVELVSNCNVDSQDSIGRTPLHYACAHSLKIVKYLIECKHCNPNVRDKGGFTAIHLSRGNKKMVEYLKSIFSSAPQPSATELPFRGDDLTINAVHHYLLASITNSSSIEPEDTPLHTACRCSNEKAVEYLVEQGCDQSAQNAFGALPLHIACDEGSLKIVKLVSNCDINATDIDGETPLHIASGSNHPAIVEFLTRTKQCSLNIRDKDGEIALHSACYQGHIEVVKLLSDCNVNSLTINGATPLHMACETVNYDIVKFLTENMRCNQTISDSGGNLPLHTALFSTKKLDLVKLVSNCDINTQNEGGHTPLHVAMSCNLKNLQNTYPNCTVDSFRRLFNESVYEYIRKDCSLSIIQFLVDKGADPTIPNEWNITPIHFACMVELDISIVQALATPANVNCRDIEGNTPLHMACCATSIKIVELLIVQGADTSLQNNIGELPLHIACKKNCTDIVDILSGNCDVNTQDREGDTPLHIACKNGAWEIARLLTLCKRCNLTLQNKAGDIPLHIACYNSYFPIMKLVSTQYVVNSQNASGDTPLHIVCTSREVWRCLRDAKNFTQELLCSQTIVNHKGELPLHIACQKKILDLVQVVSSCKEVDCNLQMVDGNTPLHLACRYESFDIVRHLILVHNCTSHITNANGELPFHLACGSNNLKLLKLVNEHTLTRILQTNQGDTPLHIALQRGQQSIVKYLLQQRNCSDFLITKNNLGELPLHIACSRRSMTVAFLNLVTCHTNNINAKIDQVPHQVRTVPGDTPLHIACRKGDPSIVEHLINELKSDVTIPNSHGELPLHIACSLNVNCLFFSKKNRMKIIKLVTECDIVAKTVTGNTAVHTACQSKALDVIKHLFSACNGRKCLPLENSKKETPLHITCSQGSFKMVKLTSRCDIINLQTECGDTPLHLACKRRFDSEKVGMHLLKYIVNHQRGCSLSILNDCLELPLHLACRNQTFDIVKLVTDCSISVNIQTASGDTALHEACRNVSSEAPQIVKYLIEEKGCDPTIMNKLLELPLHLACRRKSFELVTLLSKCHVDAVTSTGNTCLHEVCSTDTEKTEKESSSAMVEMVQYLIESAGCDPSILNRRGRTALHYACETNSKDLATYLISTDKVNISQADKSGQTPIMLTSDMEIAKTLLENNADPQPLYKMHQSLKKKHSSETPPHPRLKLLVMGNAGVGKTTLIESLKSEGKAITICIDSQLHTAGIIPNDFDSEIYGHVTIYDFAGQHEYYASHGTEMQSIIKNSPPVILLIVDLHEEKWQVKDKLLYWLSWITNVCVSTSDSVHKPHLIIIGSHADFLKSKGQCPNTKLAVIRKTIDSRILNIPLKYVGSITMDCRNPISPDITELQKCLRMSTCELQDTAVMSFTSHCFYVFLFDQFRHYHQALTIELIASTIETIFHWSMYNIRGDRKFGPRELLPTNVDKVLKICEQLDKQGYILLILNPRHPYKSWVVLDQKMLMHEIIGTVFAPSSFKEHMELASSTGVVPFSKLQIALTQHDPHMAIGLLTQFEFCHEICDEEVLKLIYNNKAGSTDDTYYFFPGLVSIETPHKIWIQDKRNKFGYQYGWILQCSESDEFFTSQFLQVVLLRLAFIHALAPSRPPFSHPLSVLTRACTVWKSGICWSNQDGIETVVELTEQNKTLVVMMRSVHESEVECIRLRASVLQKVIKTCEDICPCLKTTEYFIDSKCLQFPIPSIDTMTRCGIPNTLSAIANGKRYAVNDTGAMINIEDLLYFEPYIYLCSSILETFSSRSSERISDEFLHHMIEHLPSQKLELFRILFKLSGSAHTLVQVFQKWRDKVQSEGTYGCLQREFDQISIFGGRTNGTLLLEVQLINMHA